MKIKPEQLSSSLTDGLNQLYFVFGAEPLLIEQSLNQIKLAAKTHGFDDRVSFEIDGNFDWNQVIFELTSPSLFSPKRIIECRLTTGKIGLKGSKALTEIAGSVAKDILLIVSTGKLDLNQQKSKWVKTLEKNGAIIQHWEVKSENIIGWIKNHMTALGLESNTDVAQNIAACTQGNLSASMQEIQKLQMAYPDGKIDTKSYLEQENQQSKYSIYGLIDAALLGNSEQTLKIYDTLKNDSGLPIYLSISLHREITLIIKMAIELLGKSKQIDAVLQENHIWNTKKPAITNALKRLPYQQLQKILLLLGRIDRSIKGLDNLNVIDEFRRLLLNLSGENRCLV
ncbi:MAG: DNA polymerase III subunit delta [Candidatus Thioglobus sp.]|nr:DNA polymerase III subunit delta [Candidatus Thioglobus sp.]